MNNKEIIKVVPSYLELKKGETKELQIITDLKYKFQITKAGIIDFNSITNDITAKAAGTTGIIFEAYEEIDGKEIWKDSTTVHINVENVEYENKTIRIMMHNRANNKLTSLVKELNGESSFIFKLPSKNSTLLTKYTIQDNSIVIKPTITYPRSEVTEYNGHITCSAPKYYFGETLTHVGTEWEFSKTKEFNKKDIVRRDLYWSGDLLINTPSLFGICVYVRCRHIAQKDQWTQKKEYSEWSDPIMVTFGYVNQWLKNSEFELSKLHFSDGTFLSRNGYLGFINDNRTTSDCIWRDYRGNFVSLLKSGLNQFYKNQQVTFQASDDDEPVLYTCTPPSNINSGNYYRDTASWSTVVEQRNPKIYTDYWQVDDRKNMHTVAWLKDHIGVGFGNEIYSLYRTDYTGNHTITEVNSYDYLKFCYNGKMLIIPGNEFSNNICWNDVAKRHGVYGERTIKMGEYMFKLRLPTKEEVEFLFKDIQIRANNIKNNSKYKNTVPWHDFLTTNKTYNNILLEDFREGEKRSVANITLDENENIKIEYKDISPRSRTCTWYPILEFIQQGDEPYLRIPPCRKAVNEEFRYDKYTDAGYFGVLGYYDPMSREHAAVKTNIGTSHSWVRYDYGIGWYKIYWQGMVIYVSNGDCCSSFNGKHGLWHNHTNYVADMGWGDRLNFIINNTRYIPAGLSANRVYPFPTTAKANSMLIPNTEKTPWHNMWRLFECNTKGDLWNYGGITNNKTGSYIGNQVGDHWASYAFNGHFIHNTHGQLMQEVMSSVFSSCVSYFSNTHTNTWYTTSGNYSLPICLYLKTYRTNDEEELEPELNGSTCDKFDNNDITLILNEVYSYDPAKNKSNADKNNGKQYKRAYARTPIKLNTKQEFWLNSTGGWIYKGLWYEDNHFEIWHIMNSTQTDNYNKTRTPPLTTPILTGQLNYEEGYKNYSIKVIDNIDPTYPNCNWKIGEVRAEPWIPVSKSLSNYNNEKFEYKLI